MYEWFVLYVKMSNERPKTVYDNRNNKNHIKKKEQPNMLHQHIRTDKETEHHV